MSELKKIEETLKSFLEHLEDQIKQIMGNSHDHATKNQQILDTIQTHSAALAEEIAKSAGDDDDTEKPAAGTPSTEAETPKAEGSETTTTPADNQPEDNPPAAETETPSTE